MLHGEVRAAALQRLLVVDGCVVVGGVCVSARARESTAISANKTEETATTQPQHSHNTAKKQQAHLAVGGGAGGGGGALLLEQLRALRLLGEVLARVLPGAPGARACVCV